MADLTARKLKSWKLIRITRIEKNKRSIVIFAEFKNSSNDKINKSPKSSSQNITKSGKWSSRLC